MSLREGFQTAINAVYPTRCVGCGEMVESDIGLCADCWRDTPFIGGTSCDQCGTPLLNGPDDAEDACCDECLDAPRPWARGRAALVYRDRARKLVLAFKHGDKHNIFKPAGIWLANAARSMNLSENTLVVPIPLHWTRLAKRRYNQSALLAQSFAREAHLNVCPDVLLRQQKTPSLEGHTQYERFDILADAITVHPRRKHRLAKRPVLLLDDVMTSGATLGAATNACLAAGADRVDVLVLARASKAR